MIELNFIRDGWIDGSLEDAGERATFTRLKITAGDAVLTRAFSKRGGGETEALNIPILPLANYIAEMWWPLLYEPRRAHVDKKFPARHRLDLPMHGYVFPALAICSAGDDAVLVDWDQIENEYSPLKFLTVTPREPLQFSRETTEPMLMDLVESALARLNSGSSAYEELAGNWNRVRHSLQNEAQSAYCMAAGRLGIDPYASEAPDISDFAEGLPDELINDISDAIEVSQLVETAEWTREAKSMLASFPAIDVVAFGPPPLDDLRVAPGEIGYRAAVGLRSRLGLGVQKPRKEVDDLLGGVASNGAVLTERGPGPVTGLIHRVNGVAHIGTVAKSGRQRRFRSCAAAYIAWCSKSGDFRAGTAAITRRQQASRAFAAEILAPRQYLFERAGNSSLTEEDIEKEAGKLMAPYDTVLWQAWRGGVSLWDVEPRTPRRNFFF
jgi:hypothetical protein